MLLHHTVGRGFVVTTGYANVSRRCAELLNVLRAEILRRVSGRAAALGATRLTGLRHNDVPGPLLFAAPAMTGAYDSRRSHTARERRGQEQQEAA